MLSEFREEPVRSFSFNSKVEEADEADFSWCWGIFFGSRCCT